MMSNVSIPNLGDARTLIRYILWSAKKKLQSVTLKSKPDFILPCD
jgi:hypothetical protein